MGKAPDIKLAKIQGNAYLGAESLIKYFEFCMNNPNAPKATKRELKTVVSVLIKLNVNAMLLDETPLINGDQDQKTLQD